MSEPPIRILVIGTLPPPIGGASVLLHHLVQDLSARPDVAVTVVDTKGVRGRGPLAILRLLRTLRLIVHGLRRTDVATLQVSTGGLPLIGPIVVALARLFGRPLVVRKFGGKAYQEFGGFPRALARWAARHADLFLAETHEQVRLARADGIMHATWFPNSRPLDAGSTGRAEAEASDSDTAREPRDTEPSLSARCRRFVFAAHVRPSKGIGEVIAAGERFGEDVSIDVYGPFLDGLDESIFADCRRVRYCGEIPPETVIATLRRYDAVLLPTYWLGEGYPGIVIEAYVAGRPVITTRHKAIPEIVDESCGIMIAPRSADALYDAMRRFVDDDALYVRCARGAWAKREQFDSRRWHAWFVHQCRRLVGWRV